MFNYPFEKKNNFTRVFLSSIIFIMSLFVCMILIANTFSPNDLSDWVGTKNLFVAFLMLVLGAGLLACEGENKTFSKLCGWVLLIIGGIGTLNHLMEALFPQSYSTLALASSFATINSAFCFALSGVLLLMLARRNFKKNTFHAICVLTSIIIAFAALSLFNYVSGLRNIYGPVKVVRMSAFAAAFFILSSIAILSAAWDLLLKNRLKFSSLGVSLPIGIGFLTISLSLWYSIRAQDQIYREETIRRESAYVVTNIEYYLDETVQEIIRMTKRWELRNGMPENEWRADAKMSVSQKSAMLSLEWIDKDLIPRWIELQKGQNPAIPLKPDLPPMNGSDSNSFPLGARKNKGTIFSNIAPLFSEPKVRAPREKIISNKTAFIGDKSVLKPIPRDVLEKGKDSLSFTLFLTEESAKNYIVWIANPIRIGNQFEGYLAAAINVPLMIDEIYHDARNPLEEIEITDSKGVVLFNKNDSLKHFHTLLQNFAHFRFHGLDWTINAVFADEALSRISFLPALTLFLGVLMSGLLLAAFYFAHQSQEKAKELEESLTKLIQTQDRLIMQEKLATLGGLSAGIAHEIKNPLNFIFNFSQMSLSLIQEIQGAVDKISEQLPKQEYMEIGESINALNTNVKSIHDQGKRAQNTITRILAQSRGKPGICTPTDLHSLIEEYMTLSYHGMRSQNPAFNTKFEKNFDPHIDKISIVSEDFTRVILNLLNNAYYALVEKKKMGGETFRPEVVVITKQLGDRVEVIIHDNGTGISAQAKEKLFTPFFTTKPVGHGTGLGLSMSRQIIEEHGGILKCDSKEGEYTNFIIQLPVNPDIPLKSYVKSVEESTVNLT